MKIRFPKQYKVYIGFINILTFSPFLHKLGSQMQKKFSSASKYAFIKWDLSEYLFYRLFNNSYEDKTITNISIIIIMILQLVKRSRSNGCIGQKRICLVIKLVTPMKKKQNIHPRRTYINQETTHIFPTTTTAVVTFIPRSTKVPGVTNLFSIHYILLIKMSR